MKNKIFIICGCVILSSLSIHQCLIKPLMAIEKNESTTVLVPNYDAGILYEVDTKTGESIEVGWIEDVSGEGLEIVHYRYHLYGDGERELADKENDFSR